MIAAVRAVPGWSAAPEDGPQVIAGAMRFQPNDPAYGNIPGGWIDVELPLCRRSVFWVSRLRPWGGRGGWTTHAHLHAAAADVHRYALDGRRSSPTPPEVVAFPDRDSTLMPGPG